MKTFFVRLFFVLIAVSMTAVFACNREIGGTDTGFPTETEDDLPNNSLPQIALYGNYTDPTDITLLTNEDSAVRLNGVFGGARYKSARDASQADIVTALTAAVEQTAAFSLEGRSYTEIAFRGAELATALATYDFGDYLYSAPYGIKVDYRTAVENVLRQISDSEYAVLAMPDTEGECMCFVRTESVCDSLVSAEYYLNGVTSLSLSCHGELTLPTDREVNVSELLHPFGVVLPFAVSCDIATGSIPIDLDLSMTDTGVTALHATAALSDKYRLEYSVFAGTAAARLLKGDTCVWSNRIQMSLSTQDGTQTQTAIPTVYLLLDDDCAATCTLSSGGDIRADILSVDIAVSESIARMAADSISTTPDVQTFDWSIANTAELSLTTRRGQRTMDSILTMLRADVDTAIGSHTIMAGSYYFSLADSEHPSSPLVYVIPTVDDVFLVGTDELMHHEVFGKKWLSGSDLDINLTSPGDDKKPLSVLTNPIGLLYAVHLSVGQQTVLRASADCEALNNVLVAVYSVIAEEPITDYSAEGLWQSIALPELLSGFPFLKPWVNTRLFRELRRPILDLLSRLTPEIESAILTADVS